jgi:hypothetical protein
MKKLLLVLITVAVSVFAVHAQNSDVESLNILFPANSANLSGESPELALQNQRILAEIAQILLENPQYRILIDGHANPVLRTTKEETETLVPLSLQRATAVAKQLVELYRVDRQRLILAGAGGKYASGNDKAQNRRVSFIIITDSQNITITENTIKDEEILNIILPPLEFPSNFTGTWIRVNLEYPHTLTLSSRSIKASNQTFAWNISSISGDVYIISDSNSNLSGTIHLKLVDEYLEIIDAYDMSNSSLWSGGENDWTGTWKRR